MSSPTTLPLSRIVDVEIIVSPQAPIQPTFNQGLIVGPSTVIGDAERIRQYTNLADMLNDGFSTSSPEYIAASLYFGQTPAPQILWIGRQDLTLQTPETPLAAVQACRAASPEWWAFMVTSAVKADHEAIAAWAQTAGPPVCYFYTTADSDALAGTGGNVFSALQALNYNRAIGVYSTTQGSSFPNNAYAAAAAMGVAMGLNTGLANSYFTLKFKTLTGVASEPLSAAQVGTIEGNNGNLYLSIANAYTIMEQGVLADGQFFDEVLNLDMLASDIQFNVMNLLVDNPSIPLTDAGQTQLLHAVNQACDAAVTRGFIASGTWNGSAILNLNNGDPLPKGYLAQSPSAATQSASDRAARKSLPIYLSIIEAGSIHSVTISVLVER